MGLYEDLRNLAEQIKKRQAHVKGEEATQQALVLPFRGSTIRPRAVMIFQKQLGQRGVVGAAGGGSVRG